jgi:hypothetical protein
MNWYGNRVGGEGIDDLLIFGLSMPGNYQRKGEIFAALDFPKKNLSLWSIVLGQ